jgi:hypothetical protein
MIKVYSLFSYPQQYFGNPILLKTENHEYYTRGVKWDIAQTICYFDRYFDNKEVPDSLRSERGQICKIFAVAGTPQFCRDNLPKLEGIAGMNADGLQDELEKLGKTAEAESREWFKCCETDAIANKRKLERKL